MSSTSRPYPLAGVNFGDSALNDRVITGLNEVERVLEEALSGGEEFLSEKVLHLMRAGGKRFRPTLCLIASEFGEEPGNAHVVRAAAVVEMTHLATLYHDDVMDEASRRRGVDSANSRWGNSLAILAGDLLLARASGLLSELGMETVKHFGDTFEELVTGQMRETIGVQGEATSAAAIDHYNQVIEGKTGVLIASAGYLGGLHSGADEKTSEALRGYGQNIGTAFQIVDDIIDIYSTSEQSGKVRGTDLREGVFTLPVLYALAEDTPVGDRLRELLDGPVTDEAIIVEALDLLEASTGRERATADVQVWIDRAEACLSELPDIPARTALREFARQTVKRIS